ncbi:MAG: TraR/DksA family transcriptional regulator [Acidobacteriota bacterium]|nr:TraR/DksA family transcriptional regulator [Acidobacteriota bacterium]
MPGVPTPPASRRAWSTAPVSPDNAIGLHLVDRALRALADGEYGACRRCGEPIAEARLRARPHALSCVRSAESAAR